MGNIIQNITKKRQEEIVKGSNAFTTSPIYVVYQITETVCEATTEFSQSTSFLEEKESIGVYNDDEFVECDFDEEGALKVSKHDKFVTLCFTREGAENFIKADKHNLNQPYIFVHHVSYRNEELSAFLRILGDK